MRLYEAHKELPDLSMPMHLWGSTQTWEVAGLEEADSSAKEVAGCVRTRAYITVRWSMPSTIPKQLKNLTGIKEKSEAPVAGGPW